MKDKDRFVVTKYQGNVLSNHFQVIVDKQTGINYLAVRSGYGMGLTVLLDENGKPLITRKEDL